MPQEFNLDEVAVAGVEQMLFDTGQQVEEEADRAANLVLEITSRQWQGMTSTAAASKVHNEFIPAKQALVSEINFVSEALGMGRKAVMGQDEEGMQSILTVEPGGGEFDQRLNPS